MTNAERAQRMQSVVLQRLQSNGLATSIANATGMSEGTISRLKNEHLDNFCQMLAHAGLKIVEAERTVVDADTYRAIAHIATKAMRDPQVARWLVIGDPE
jgi:hypothetical protein